MTSSGIEKAQETASAPLPRLKVQRETWCDQVAVDAAADALQANPDLLEEFQAEERLGRNHEYFTVVYDVLDYLAEQGGPLPDTLVGKLDLATELSRRVRAATGMPEFKPRGHAIAPGPDKMPPLISLAVGEGAQRGNVTQELADKILQESYAARPDLWFAAAEEYRHLTLIYGTEELRRQITGRVEADSAAKNNAVASEIFGEAARRIYRMCGIPL